MKTLKLQLDDELMQRLVAASQADDRTPEHYVIRAIKQSLDGVFSQQQTTTVARIPTPEEILQIARQVIPDLKHVNPPPGTPVVDPVAAFGPEAREYKGDIAGFKSNPNKPVEMFGLIEQDSLQGQRVERVGPRPAAVAPVPLPAGVSLFPDHK